MAEHPDSWYVATAKGLSDYPALAGDTDCDVCVIGGGYTGLSCALHLARLGYRVVLLEAARVGWGASGRNGGQVGSGQRLEQDELEKMTGRDTARALWEIAEDAKALVQSLIRELAIDCDYRPGVLHAAHTPALAAQTQDYAEYLNTHYGYDRIRPVSVPEMRTMLGTRAYYGGTLDEGAGHLHPLNYALGLARGAAAAGVQLFEHSAVSEISGKARKTVKTAGGQVSARYVMLACNGYLGRLEPRIESMIMPINNFILATEPLGETLAREIIRDDVAVADTKFVINYFRLSADKRLLFGGGENYTRAFPRDMKAFVRRYMLKIYPQLADTRIDYAWGGTLGITLNRMPHIGRLPDDVFFAQGFSGHGVAMATMAGKLAAEAMDGTASRFDVYSRVPMRAFPGGRWLRYPAQVAGMLLYSLRDRIA
ncbi:FAD-binding oxidoreductase [Granulosicoccaceae sp. 1_MG-2023]|nr:FAD-binding oxidoreductase [Granulosicoccaceae sp. 1_MG-2023]